MKGKVYENKLFTVLLADDDADDRQIFQEAFDQLGLDMGIHTVKNGEEALLFLDAIEPKPEILFLDLNMPVMNGRECLREIKKDPRFDNLCIAIYSTSANEEDIEETLALGAHVYIKKPNDFDELKQILYKVITWNGHCKDPYLKRDFFMMSLGT
jgi:CheY-like chemotaxis protein